MHSVIVLALWLLMVVWRMLVASPNARVKTYEHTIPLFAALTLPDHLTIQTTTTGRMANGQVARQRCLLLSRGCVDVSMIGRRVVLRVSGCSSSHGDVDEQRRRAGHGCRWLLHRAPRW